MAAYEPVLLPLQVEDPKIMLRTRHEWNEITAELIDKIGRDPTSVVFAFLLDKVQVYGKQTPPLPHCVLM